MNIVEKKEGEKLIVSLEGSLDSLTAPMLEERLRSLLTDQTALVIDCKSLQYVSSAGLRVFLWAAKKMKQQGEMELCHVGADVMSVLRMTGFTEILNIRQVQENEKKNCMYSYMLEHPAVAWPWREHI